MDSTVLLLCQRAMDFLLIYCKLKTNFIAKSQLLYHRYPKLYGRLDRVTFDRYATAKLYGFVWEKNVSFFNLKIRTDCQ